MDRLSKMGKNFGGNFEVIFVVSAYTGVDCKNWRGE
jgi:hypothetical protein